MATIENENQINFDNLLKQGLAVVDVRYRNYEITNEQYKYVIVRVEGDRDAFYNNMLKQYLGKDFKDKNVYEIWSKVLKHKLELSEKLERDVPIKVATLDYFEN